MPLFDFLCLDCGKTHEILITGSENQLKCQSCGSYKLKKLLAAHSSCSGSSNHSGSEYGNNSCCGSTPSQAGCAGPGSCCGSKV